MAFSNIIGHDSIVRKLEFAFQQDRIPSSYLFVGSEGIGKSSLVKDFAQMANCETHDNCHNCDSCRMFDNGMHPDFYVIKPDGQGIRIKQIHELIGHLDLKPTYAKKRVVLVKEAHKMNQESANSFLKILEEPSLDTLIILMTPDESRLLETINSRCHKVFFSQLTVKDIRSIVNLNYQLDPDILDFVLCFAQGRIRKIFIEKAAALANMRVQVLHMLNNLKTENLYDHTLLLDHWVKQDLHNFFLEFCMAWLRDFVSVRKQGASGVINSDIMDELETASSSFSEEALQWSFDLVVETELAIQSNASKNLALESLLIQLKQIFWGTPVV
ncbi:MAG: DNA polymerase III subunit [SAR324 cluster bacterium]|nr:DNA polymerase III subunit [SAR324 cluster bacterium]